MDITDKKECMYTLDFGEQKIFIYDGKKIKSLDKDELFNLPCNLPSGSVLIVEDAHMGVPRSEKSLAQPFTKKELLTFYGQCETNNIKLKLFPQKSTPRAIDFSKLEKSDENDPISLYNLIQAFPQISLKNPPNFQRCYKQEEGHKRKKEVDKVINFARRYQYKHENDANIKWLKDNIAEIEAKMQDVTKSVFFKKENYRYKNSSEKENRKIGDINFREVADTQIYAVLSCMRGYSYYQDDGFGIDDRLFLREKTGRLPSWGFTQRYILHMSPYHFKGGVARSNLYHHGAKKWIVKKAEEDGVVLTIPPEKKKKGESSYKKRGEFTKKEEAAFLKYRRQYANAIKDVYNIMKGMLEQQMGV